MKARVKATGEIVEVYPSIHKGCDYDGSDGYSYVKEDVIILDDEPNYWEKLLHQYAGMAMNALLLTNNIRNGDLEGMRECNTNAMAIAHALVQKLKEKEERK